MQGRHPHRHRRALALMTCLLWLLGVEVLPSLHLAHHHGDHTHAADGSIVLAHREHDEDHDHDAAVDEDPDADHDHDAAVDEDPDPDADHDHGHHHHAAAAAAVAAAHADHHHDGDTDGDQPALDHPRHAHHQAGGISHHAAALHRPPPPLLAPAFVARATWRLELPAETPARSASLARPTSRGPPTV